jgi:hypothetical protein
MGIEIPKKIFGREVEGAMERALAKKEAQPEPTSSPTNAPSLDGFEYVPTIGLYVAKEKEMFGKNWDECQTDLHNRGDRMPTISEYVEFINHLRAQNTDEAIKILDEIYTVRGPWRSEWLDAKFSVDNDTTIMIYNTFTQQGIELATVNLQGILAQDKKPGIDLDLWLADNEYGVPKSTISDGDLWYWHPRNNSVARFVADSGRTLLGCDGDPSGRLASLGVRAVRLADAQNLGGTK